jgi:hypothetical protein
MIRPFKFIKVAFRKDSHTVLMSAQVASVSKCLVKAWVFSLLLDGQRAQWRACRKDEVENHRK